MTAITGTTTVYSLALQSAFNKELDFNSDTLKVAQVTASYTPNQDTHQYFDISVTGECSGSGYTAGGASVTGSFSYDGSTNKFKLLLSNITSAWSGNTVTNCRYLVVYDATPGSNKPLLAYVDLGEDSQVLTVNWNPDGLFYAQVA